MTVEAMMMAKESRSEMKTMTVMTTTMTTAVSLVAVISVVALDLLAKEALMMVKRHYLRHYQA